VNNEMKLNICGINQLEVIDINPFSKERRPSI
jgi:hypothetical protein